MMRSLNFAQIYPEVSSITKDWNISLLIIRDRCQILRSKNAQPQYDMRLTDVSTKHSFNLVA